MATQKTSCEIANIYKAIDRANDIINIRILELQDLKKSPVDRALYQLISNEIDFIQSCVIHIEEEEL